MLRLVWFAKHAVQQYRYGMLQPEDVYRLDQAVSGVTRGRQINYDAVIADQKSFFI